MVRVFGAGKFLGMTILKKTMVLGGATALILVLGVAGFILTQDLARFVPDLDERLSTQTGQSVEVNGPVRVSLALDDVLWVSLEDIAIAPSASDDYSATVEKVRIRVALLPLLSRQILTEVLEVTGGRFLVENGTSLEEAFQELPGQERKISEDGWTSIGFRRLQLNRSFIGIVETGEEIFSFPISNFSAEPGEVGLALSLKGVIEGREVVFEGTSGKSVV